METLETTLSQIHDWAVDRIHYLCDVDDGSISSLEDAHAIRSEFFEWLDPNIYDHDIFSLEYIGDDEDGGVI